MGDIIIKLTLEPLMGNISLYKMIIFVCKETQVIQVCNKIFFFCKIKEKFVSNQKWDQVKYYRTGYLHEQNISSSAILFFFFVKLGNQIKRKYHFLKVVVLQFLSYIQLVHTTKVKCRLFVNFGLKNICPIFVYL